MPSSTSSSSWRATWLLALAIAGSLIGLCEYEARHHDQRPSVDDTPTAWATLRRSVDGDPNVVVFVGTSRIVLGTSLDAFAEAAPGTRPVQLGVNGMLPFAALDDLAQDPDFRGVVVFDVIELEVPRADPFHDPEMAPYLARARALWRAPGEIANNYLAGWVQSWLAVLAIKGSRLLHAWIPHLEWPTPTWVVADRDRVWHADYALATRDALDGRIRSWMGMAGGPAEPPERWLALTQRVLEPRFRQIRAHGGDVVVLHMPTTGRFGEALDRLYPRAPYWDVFARNSAAHVWHFRDLPAMAQLICRDDVHLDGGDQATFTRALVEQMRAQHVLRP